MNVRMAQLEQRPGTVPPSHGSLIQPAGYQPDDRQFGRRACTAPTNTRQNPLYEKGNLDQRVAAGRVPDRHR